MSRKVLCPAIMACMTLSLDAAVVHVTVKTAVDGAEYSVNSYETFNTGSTYATQTAPYVSGAIFSHWSISTKQNFISRDIFGRAYDSVQAIIYENTEFIANYTSVGVDHDGDGVDDGHEFYWYGNLDYDASSDTDGDGADLATEVERGSNPHLADESFVVVLNIAETGLFQVNLRAAPPYIIRSDPDGVLFSTITNYIAEGELVSTSDMNVFAEDFGYWLIDGVVQRDVLGRALDVASFLMGTSRVDIVAVLVTNEYERASLYWYGRTGIDPDMDSDGDGVTFREELEIGTNPLLADEIYSSELIIADTDEFLYNPKTWQPYIIRSNPEDLLVKTREEYVRPGTIVTTPSFVPGANGFAGWRIDGEIARDIIGRSLDSVSFTMPETRVEVVAEALTNDLAWASIYWYGRDDVSMDEDTDGDGVSFADELSNGSNPLLADSILEYGLRWTDTGLVEADLQKYESLMGVVVDGEYRGVFSKEIFGDGQQIWPVVTNLNGDCLFDIIVCWEGGCRVFINIGSEGNPEFTEATGFPTEGVCLSMNDPSKLASVTLDVAAPVDALSATCGDSNNDDVIDLLVSDSDGRIWYYKGNGGASFTLQHKVWGGSHAGFAEGLRLAAVDWEDDGDLDCLAGTADGKLMLLRDPKVGRPTNLKALAGVDNILLTWDPNAQSRIRGYRVYRGNGEQVTGNGFERIAQPQLPTYRDFPDKINEEYAYKVSSVSRFYTAGNSTPTETESMPTEAVTARAGGVEFVWRDVNCKVGERVEVVLSINNALNYNVAGNSEKVKYDATYLRPVEVLKSGLTEGIKLIDSWDDAQGEWTVSMTEGVLPAGSGRFLTFVFTALTEGETKVGGATVTISSSPTYIMGDIDGDGDVDVDDLRLLAKLKSAAGRRYTDDQLKAGDFNGNGKLDNADYQALRALLKEARVL